MTKEQKSLIDSQKKLLITLHKKLEERMNGERILSDQFYIISQEIELGTDSKGVSREKKKFSNEMERENELKLREKKVYNRREELKIEIEMLRKEYDLNMVILNITLQASGK